jgi:hypothetical protein
MKKKKMYQACVLYAGVEISIICLPKVKVKVISMHTMKAEVRVEVQFHSFLASVLDGADWSASWPSHFTARKNMYVYVYFSSQ